MVAELLLGIVIGPDVLGLAAPTDLLEFLGQLGLGFLFFFAGYEIRFDRVRGTPLRLAAIGWVCSLVLAYSLAGLLEAGGIVISGLLTGSAMATTALGTLIPLLRDTHQLDTPSGSHVLAVGAVGEFGPVLIVTLLLGATSDTATEALLLVAFVVVAVLAATIATGAVGRSWDFLERSLKTSGQLPVRLTVLSVFALVVLAADLGLDVILGAFAAGLLVQTVLQGKELERFESKLDAVGFGLLIPFFFVTSGIAFDLDSLISSAGALLKLPLFLGLFLVVRGLPVLCSTGASCPTPTGPRWRCSRRRSCRWSSPSPRSASSRATCARARPPRWSAPRSSPSSSSPRWPWPARPLDYGYGCGCGLSPSSIRLRCASVNSRAIDGSTSTTATPKTISTLVSVALGAAPSAIVSVFGQQVGVLGDAPAPDHGGDGADRERARAAARRRGGAGRAPRARRAARRSRAAGRRR